MALIFLLKEIDLTLSLLAMKKTVKTILIRWTFEGVVMTLGWLEFGMVLEIFY